MNNDLQQSRHPQASGQSTPIDPKGMSDKRPVSSKKPTAEMTMGFPRKLVGTTGFEPATF
ncbi:MAG: hypothetical protein DWQ29_11470 [Planctomycetota bacterium]|nr:MAG: hypothetical protein DWQ29_11470 [Planctomycetota bacterium]REK27880.1 MAG: hypothetical protein DWQ41_07200 [Planctomycetota bacterium]